MQLCRTHHSDVCIESSGWSGFVKYISYMLYVYILSPGSVLWDLLTSFHLLMLETSGWWMSYDVEEKLGEILLFCSDVSQSVIETDHGWIESESV